MSRVIFFGLVFFCLFFSSLVAAQVAGFPEGGGIPVDLTQNSSPTPIGGYTTFTTWCTSPVFTQSVVCESFPCDSTTPFLCKSTFSSVDSHQCAVPVSNSFWGWNTSLNSACCNLSGSCSDISTTYPWVAGVSASANIPSATSTSGFDPRGFKLVRRTSTNWVAVFNTSSDAQITTTSDGGLTWTAPFSVKSLFSQSNLPNGIVYSSVTAVQPALALNPDSSVELVFEVRDGAGNPAKSNVYFSRCTAASCNVFSNWQTAIPVLPSAVTETCNGGTGVCSWNYSLSAPKVVVTDSKFVHVVFSDADLSVSRINGIFHRFCDSVSSCNTLSDWSQPVDGADILKGGGLGFARSPHVSTYQDDLVAVWLDSPPGNLSSTIFVSRYDSVSNTWSMPAPVSSLGNFLSPWVSMGDSRLLVSSLNNSLISVWECPSSCFGTLSSPASWSDVTSYFDGLNGLSSLQEAAVVVSPFNSSEAVVLTSALLGSVRQVYGSFYHSGVKIGPKQLVSTPASFSLDGLSDVSGAAALQNQPDTFSLIQFLGGASSYGKVYSSTIFSSANSPPFGNIVEPSTPVTWQSLSNAAFSGSTTFYARDMDAEDNVFASVYLSTSPSSLDYPIRTFVDLRALQGVVSGVESCSGSNGFTNLESCTLDLPLFNPLVGLSVPDGEYYLVLALQDSRGGTYSVSTPGLVTIDLSNVQVSVLSPLPNVAWAGPLSHNFMVNVSQSKFAQSLDVSIRGSVGGSVIDLVSIPVSSFGTTSPGCVRVNSDYNCTLAFASNASLPEGSYFLLADVLQDGWVGVDQTISNIILDFIGPRVVSSLPSGTISSAPASISFILSDFSTIAASPQITINGNSSPASCGAVSQTVSCSAPFPSSISSGDVVVLLNAVDGRGNSSQSSFSFTISNDTIPCTGPNCGGSGGGSGGGGGGGGGSGKGIIPDLDDLVKVDPNGNIIVPGIPFVIPKVIVETLGSFSNNVVLSTSNLINVVGPSSNAIFLGLCVIAGLASDVVFRRIFSRVRADLYKQRERLVRTLLAGIFFAIPLAVGWSFSLVAGFIFTVMEIVGFIAAAYVFKLLQYYETFGYKNIQAISSGAGFSSGGAKSPSKSSSFNNASPFERPPL